METISINIKEELHQMIDDIDDVEFLKAVQTIISSKLDEGVSEYGLTEEEIQIVEEQREKYLKKEGKNYTWDEVKAFAKSSKGK
jgi:lipoate-protein ligase A